VLPARSTGWYPVEQLPGGYRCRSNATSLRSISVKRSKTTAAPPPPHPRNKLPSRPHAAGDLRRSRLRGDRRIYRWCPSIGRFDPTASHRHATAGVLPQGVPQPVVEVVDRLPDPALVGINASQAVLRQPATQVPAQIWLNAAESPIRWPSRTAHNPISAETSARSTGHELKFCSLVTRGLSQLDHPCRDEHGGGSAGTPPAGQTPADPGRWVSRQGNPYWDSYIERKTGGPRIFSKPTRGAG